MSVLDAVGSIARFCVKSVEEGFSEKADIIKDCQAEAKWYGNEELFVVYQAAIRRYNNTRKERDKWCIWGYGRELKRRGLICDNGEYYYIKLWRNGTARAFCM